MSMNEDERIAFAEEQRNLDQVEQKLQVIITDSKNRAKKQQDEILDFPVYDNTDWDRKRDLISDRKRLNDKVKEYQTYLDSPYFGRFDLLQQGGDAYTYLIGEKGLTIGNEQLILDWRSPMGETFYNKGQRSFSVKGMKYDLQLRRSVEIKAQKLEKVKTEYDAVNLSLEGEVVDDFLLSVLRDKRRNYKLTHIIRTIQGNQNKIIRKPLAESFVVQGCAGSGKTMILLHRLSYIAYNYPQINFFRFFILTPNENFNIHINELSISLGLDKIQRYSVEAFYALLINGMAREDVLFHAEQNRNVPKISADTSTLSSEKLMSPALLSNVYSTGFFDNCIKQYKNHEKAAVERLKEKKIFDRLKKYDPKTTVFSEIRFKAFSVLSHLLRELLSKHTSASRMMRENEVKRKDAAEKAAHYSAITEEKEKAALQAADTLKRYCAEVIAALEREGYTSIITRRKSEAAIERAENEKTKIFDHIRTIESSLNMIKRDPKSVLQSDYLSASEDEIAGMIRLQFPDELTQLKELNAELNSLAFYNFGRRAQIRRTIAETQRSLEEKAEPIVLQYIESRDGATVQLRHRIAELDDEITEANAAIASSFEKHKGNAVLLQEAKACSVCFESGDMPDLLSMQSIESPELSDHIRYYQQTRTMYERSRTESDRRNATLKRLEEENAVYLKQTLSDDDYDAFTEAAQIVAGFDMSVLSKRLEDDLQSLYETYGQQYSSKDTYRHKLCLKLLLCALYYGFGGKADYYVHIDEAQDLAVSEYRLLKMCFGEKTVFNLYGDVNQLIYDYKGIADWNLLVPEIVDKVELLNENYRNTTQITEYCNRQFDADITAIGLSGVEVDQKDSNSALREIEAIHKAHPLYRTAIIYKRGLPNVNNVIEQSISLNCQYHKIESSAISVITVEEAKGLEFDAVVVLENNMSVNERYLAYTRALDHLIITAIPV